MMWCFWCLVVTYVVVSNANVIDSALIVCPNDFDCVVNCSPYTRNCYNKNIVCPSSNNSLTYNCTVNCVGKLSCVGVVIESTNAVSTLMVQSLNPYGCQNVDIRANGTEKVVLMCEGAQGCTHTNLTSSGGTYVVLSSVNGTNGDTSAFYDGTLNISNTQNVNLTCNVWGCTGSRWILDNVENLNIQCLNFSACAGNSIKITDATNVTLEADMGTTYTMWQNRINISDVENLVIKIGNIEVRGWFSLLNIKNFLFDVDNFADTIITWTAQNVSNVALNNWNATSFWVVDGMPIQPQYKCPNGRDCNIRVDANLLAGNLSLLPVICPTDLASQSDSPEATTCRFYCTSVTSGCSIVDLSMNDITNAGIYINGNPPLVAPFSVNASARGLKNANTMMNITCGQQSCRNNTLVVSDYDYVNIVAIGMFAYANGTLNMSGFSHLTATLNYQALQNTNLTLTDGVSVNFQSYLDMNGIVQGSNCKFNNIERVAINCLNSYDCLDATFESINVSEVSLVCGDINNLVSSGNNCGNTIVKNLQNSSLNVTCHGMYQACADMIIQYNGSNPDETSFTMNCAVSPVAVSVPNCQNISIDVTDNKRGYDAISFSCQINTWYNNEDYPACEDVTVSCGTDGLLCRCPVKYNDNKDTWYCDGECGTSTCPADDSKSNKRQIAYIVGGVVLGTLLILIGIAIFLRKKYCNKQAFQPLIDGTKNNYTY